MSYHSPERQFAARATGSAPTKPAEIPTWQARALTDGGPLAQIVLDDKCYALRITRQGKLILTR
jgi:hemin uptake protein HemP